MRHDGTSLVVKVVIRHTAGMTSADLLPDSVHGGPLRILQLMGEATGGIAGHVASLSTDLVAAGLKVKVGTTAASAAALPPDTPNVEVLWPRRGGSLRQVRKVVAAADVVHAHGHQAGTLAVLARAALPPGRRPRVVVTWHNALLADGWQAVAGAALERVQVRGADLVTGASSDLVARARELGGTNAELSVVAAPDLTPWQGDRAQARTQLAAELGLPADHTWVLTVSRIAPQKNLPVLVDAAAQLPAGVEWLVVGAGDEELETRLHEQIQQTKAPVRLVGARRDVPRLMAVADLLALPSQWEARSLVVQEALVAGLPCIVSDAGGLTDLVQDAGLLVPVGDAGALADAVRRIVEEPGLAELMRDASRRLGAELPGLPDVLEYWVHRYADLME